MDAQTKIYKNVELYDFRTPEIIDTIIECKNNGMNGSQIAEIIGIETHHPLSGIFRKLREGGYIDNGLRKETKSEKKTKPKKEFKKIREAKTTFDNYYGQRKTKARDLISETIIETKKQRSNILTLPADKWIMEKNILKKKDGYKFTAVERDKETYKEMMQNLASDNRLLNSIEATANKSIAEVVKNEPEDTYSSAILDYCGFIDSFYDEINDIMKRKLVRKNGYIIITLAENDRAINNPLQLDNYSNNLIKNCYAGETANGAEVTNNLMNILVFNNVGYSVVKKFSYKDKTTKMQLFIIKRTD